MNKISPNDSYEVVFTYLDYLYQTRKSEFNWDLPILLGSMQLLADGKPADPAYWHDWLKCLPSTPLSIQETYEAMIAFLKQYISRGDQGEITKVVDLLTGPRTPDLEAEWSKIFYAYVEQD